MVIWIIGISGSGKSTLGNMLKKHFDEKKIKSQIIDGDVVRSFFEDDLGYSVEDRKQNIKRILLASYFLEKNGVIPIICNIGPFESLRIFARDKFKDYVQIYLHKEIESAKKNDVKNVYKENINVTPIVGLDLLFEVPEINELFLRVDQESKEDSLKRIVDYVEAR
jgi:adenylylsulfate kinase-like enzyme